MTKWIMVKLYIYMVYLTIEIDYIEISFSSISYEELIKIKTDHN